jgi:hypothetical protein
MPEQGEDAVRSHRKISGKRLSVLVAGESQSEVLEKWGVDGWHLLADNCFIDRSSVTAVGFCRDLKRDALFVVLPKAYSSRLQEGEGNESDIRRHAYSLLRLLNKIRKKEHLALEASNTARAGGKARLPLSVLDSLEAALAIRSDYKENGLYTRKSIKTAIGKTSYPINWSKTHRRFQPQFDDGQIFFPGYVNNQRAGDLSHPLTQLHLLVIEDISRLVGERGLSSEHRSLYQSISGRVRRDPLGTLKRLSAEVFDERGIFLLRCMRAYFGDRALRTKTIKGPDDLLGYSRDFENIWEYVLRELLHSSERKRTLPQGEWVEFPTYNRRKGIVPRLDAVADTDYGTVILDAKDYRVYTAGEPWQARPSDFYQQMIYRLLVEAQEKSRSMSILLFPSMKYESLFTVHGYHRWAEIPSSQVFEVSVNYEIATKCWMREIRINARAELEKLVAEVAKCAVS